MQNDFKKLDELSRMFHMDVQELSSLDSMYKEMVRVLHENKSKSERRELRCKRNGTQCTGAVFVSFNVSVIIRTTHKQILFYRKSVHFHHLDAIP